MSDKYTPTTDEVRNNMAFAAALAAAAIRDGHEDWQSALRDINWPVPGMRDARKEAFDRWLAQHDREVAAERDAMIAAVRELHAETACEEDCCGASPCCSDCGPGYGWPCPTIKALDGES